MRVGSPLSKGTESLNFGNKTCEVSEGPIEKGMHDEGQVTVSAGL